MNRSTETQIALLTLLLKRRKEVFLLCDLGKPLLAQGFTEAEIMDVLIKLAHEKVVELLPGNQLRVLRRSG
ncbi:hypothetical protein ATY81_00055 [Rhizobium sp. R72]|nr:hypothetical protein ATY81_00055 [Rhizobium sp. R72]OWW05493.1 hypothetical protein ATY80_00055 [Rhizobium sp. R711]